MIKKGPISIEGEVIASEKTAPKLSKAAAASGGDTDPYLVYAILGLIAPIACSGLGVVFGLPMSIHALKGQGGTKTLAIVAIVLNSLALLCLCGYLFFMFAGTALS